MSKLKLGQRLRAFYKFEGRCFYCGTRMYVDEFTIDHLFPQSKGGSHHPDNLVPACPQCNALKGDMTVLQFKSRLFPNYKLFYEEVCL